jgi:hypothetical protein
MAMKYGSKTNLLVVFFVNLFAAPLMLYFWPALLPWIVGLLSASTNTYITWHTRVHTDSLNRIYEAIDPHSKQEG